MKANELRIGNYLIELGNDPDPEGRIFRVTAIYGINIERFVVEDDERDIMNSNFLAAIPLTEEWLLKFGFEKEDDFFRKDCGRKSLAVHLDAQDDNSGDIWVGYREDVGLDYFTLTLCETEYIHQIQNIYFSLTGEELTIKD